MYRYFICCVILNLNDLINWFICGKLCTCWFMQNKTCFVVLCLILGYLYRGIYTSILTFNFVYYLTYSFNFLGVVFYFVILIYMFIYFFHVILYVCLVLRRIMIWYSWFIKLFYYCIYSLYYYFICYIISAFHWFDQLIYLKCPVDFCQVKFFFCNFCHIMAYL